MIPSCLSEGRELLYGSLHGQAESCLQTLGAPCQRCISLDNPHYHATHLKDRKSKGVTRDQGEDLMAKLVQKLSESMKSKVGEIKLFCTKVHKFMVHVARPGAVEVALIFKEILAADSSLHFNGRIQYTVAERKEEDERRFQKKGKC